MSVPLVVLGVLVAMTIAAYVASAPMTYGARRRTIERRRRWVAEHPAAAKSHDVVDLLRRSGLLVREARSLSDTATARGVRSVTLYRWLDRLDDDVRVTVLRAGLSDAHLVDHVRRGTLPDLPGVREFAAAHGLAVAPVEDGGAGRETDPPQASAEEVVAEAVVPESVAVETLEDVEQLAAVALKESPVAAPAPAAETAVVVEPPAVVADAPPAASATLLGADLGSQTPVP